MTPPESHARRAARALRRLARGARRAGSTRSSATTSSRRTATASSFATRAPRRTPSPGGHRSGSKSRPRAALDRSDLRQRSTARPRSSPATGPDVRRARLLTDLAATLMVAGRADEAEPVLEEACAGGRRGRRRPGAAAGRVPVPRLCIARRPGATDGVPGSHRTRDPDSRTGRRRAGALPRRQLQARRPGRLGPWPKRPTRGSTPPGTPCGPECSTKGR